MHKNSGVKPFQASRDTEEKPKQEIGLEDEAMHFTVMSVESVHPDSSREWRVFTRSHDKADVLVKYWLQTLLFVPRKQRPKVELEDVEMRYTDHSARPSRCAEKLRMNS